MQIYPSIDNYSSTETVVKLQLWIQLINSSEFATQHQAPSDGILN